MTLWFRLIWVIVSALLRARVPLLARSKLTFRVMPTDLDINVHMTNARYLSFMDLGRTDLIVRTGLGKLMIKHRLQAVIGGSLVRYRRPLRPFQRFNVKTRLAAWDDRWLYLEQVVISGDQIACVAQLKGAFIQKGKIIPPDELFHLLGSVPPETPVPAWVSQWKDTEAAAFAPL